MKKIALLMVLIALFAVSATALQVPNLALGSSNQDRNANLSVAVTITNTNGGNLSNIQVTPSPTEAKYAMVVSNVPQNITGSTGQFTLTVTLPLDHPAVDASTLKETGFHVGTFTVSATNSSGGQESSVGNVSMQAVNQLEIDKVRLECDSTSKSIDDGDDVNNLKPGESCTMEIEVKNNFDDDDRNDLRIGDVDFDTVTINVDSSDTGDVDIDDDNDIDDISSDDEDIATFEIEIDEEADDGKVSVDIEVSAFDENGALHGEALEFDLDIERLTHDIQLRSVDLTPNRISVCEDSNVRAVANILNQGKRDEDEVAVEVSVEELKFTDKRDNIELDRDERESASFDIPVPSNTKPGVIRVDFRTFFDNVAQSNTGSVDLTVEECAIEEPEEDTSSSSDNTPSTVVVPNPTPVQVTPPSAPAPSPTQATAAPKKSGFTDSTAYVVLLIVGIVFVLVVIGVLLVVLLRRR